MLYDYKDRDAVTQLNQILELLNQIFTFIFLGEALVKIFAMGFALGHRAYLKESWNVIDFFIVIAG